MFEAYITNLGKYNEGKLCGENLKFPTTTEEVKALLSRIGIDGVLYEEYFITNYESEIAGLSKFFGEYESIDELNYFATLLKDLNEYELENFIGAVEYSENIESAKDLINLTYNLDNYIIYPDVENEEDLGRFYVEQLSALEIPDDLEQYFDYEAYGRDINLNSNGIFSEKCEGYIECFNNGFTEHYSGKDDIPDEYKVFAYPDVEKISMQDKLQMYQQMTKPTFTVKLAQSREDR